RLTPATITVVGTLDDPGLLIPTGPGMFTDTTLRGAITAANAMPGQDLINFVIPGGGVQTISVGTALPAITESVVIKGGPIIPGGMAALGRPSGGAGHDGPPPPPPPFHGPATAHPHLPPRRRPPHRGARRDGQRRGKLSHRHHPRRHPRQCQ